MDTKTDNMEKEKTRIFKQVERELEVASERKSYDSDNQMYWRGQCDALLNIREFLSLNDLDCVEDKTD